MATKKRPTKRKVKSAEWGEEARAQRLAREREDRRGEVRELLSMLGTSLRPVVTLLVSDAIDERERERQDRDRRAALKPDPAAKLSPATEPMKQHAPTPNDPRPALTADRCPHACMLRPEGLSPCCMPEGHGGTHLAWNSNGVAFEWEQPKSS